MQSLPLSNILSNISNSPFVIKTNDCIKKVGSAVKHFFEKVVQFITSLFSWNKTKDVKPIVDEIQKKPTEEIITPPPVLDESELKAIEIAASTEEIIKEPEQPIIAFSSDPTPPVVEEIIAPPSIPTPPVLDESEMKATEIAASKEITIASQHEMLETLLNATMNGHVVEVESIVLNLDSIDSLEELKVILTLCPKLTKIKLSMLFDKKLAEILKGCTAVKDIELTWNKQVKVPLVTLVDACPQLERITLNDFESSNKYELEHLTEKCESLKSITINGKKRDDKALNDPDSLDTQKKQNLFNSIKELDLLKMIKHGKNLNHLALNYAYQLTDATLNEIANYCTNLETLHLEKGNPLLFLFVGKRVPHISLNKLKYLLFKCPNLKKIVAEECPRSMKMLSDLAALKNGSAKISSEEGRVILTL